MLQQSLQGLISCSPLPAVPQARQRASRASSSTPACSRVRRGAAHTSPGPAAQRRRSREISTRLIRVIPAATVTEAGPPFCLRGGLGTVGCCARSPFPAKASVTRTRTNLAPASRCPAARGALKSVPHAGPGVTVTVASQESRVRARAAAAIGPGSDFGPRFMLARTMTPTLSPATVARPGTVNLT